MPHSRAQVQYAELADDARRAVPGAARAPASATPAPIRPSARTSRCSRSGWRTARTASTRSSSTSPSPRRTPRRPGRTAGPAAPRRPPCWSDSSTRPRSSWASTRSSCAAATSSTTTRSRSRRSRARATTAAPTPPPFDVAAETIGYGELREEQRRRRERGDRVQLGIGVASYVEITAGGGDVGVRRGRGPRRRFGDGPRRHALPTARATRRRSR